ncbi:MAG: hypothetical protein AAGD05_13395 [Bacteroidota bacterium]
MALLRFIAHFLSIVFHPLLLLTYMLIILLTVNPYLFGVNTIGDSKILVMIIFLSTFLIPAVGIVMMRFLGLISSLQMPDKRERIGPYIITGIFYIWMFRNLLDHPDVPNAYKVFVLGATLALFMAFIINLFSKISMHAVGMGGLVGMVVLTMLLFSYNTFLLRTGLFGTLQVSMNAVLMLALLIAGLVCTARLLLSAHTLQDIYGGFIVGFSMQFLAVRFLL